MDSPVAKQHITLDKEIQDVKNLLAEIVDPKLRASIEINPNHITMLNGVKPKKQLSRKIIPKKKKTLTRKEYANLGLYNIPTKSLKYKDVLPLHELWKGYIREHLGLTNNKQSIPTVSDPGYDAFSKALVKSDFHGAKITVCQSKCPSLVRLSGIIALDTKNTFKIVGEDDKLRTIPKTECVFNIKLGNIDFTLFGKHLTIRPAERSVRKIKNFMDLDL